MSVPSPSPVMYAIIFVITPPTTSKTQKINIKWIWLRWPNPFFY